jgi:hypothetical protein
MGGHAEAWERDRQIVLAHLQNMMLALRSNVKFSSKTRLLHAPGSYEHPLALSVQKLRDRLCDPLASHVALDSDVILQPFVDVAVSAETTEPITGVALAAFVAFLELKCEFIRTHNLTTMCRCARDSRSEVMDTQSHEAIVARILQVFVGCMRHPASVTIDEDVVVEMLQAAFAIATQGNNTTSELLRRTAEQAMNDIVSHLFSNVVGHTEGVPSSYAGVMRYISKLVASQPILPDGVTSLAAAPSVQLQGLCLAHTALFVAQDTIRHPRCKPLLQCVCNDLARAMLRVGRYCDNVVVLAQMLRTMHLLVSFASTTVVPQLLSFLRVVHLAPDAAEGDADRREREELLFESLLEFSADPAFPAFLFHHYDMSIEFESVLEPYCSFLERACHRRATASADLAREIGQPITQTNILAMDCLLAIMSSLSDRLRQGIVDAPADLDQMLQRKRSLIDFSASLKDEPKKAVRALVAQCASGADLFGLGTNPGPVEFAKFFYQHTALLDKAGVADYLSEIGKGPPRPDDRHAEELATWKTARAGETAVVGSIGFHQALLAEFLALIPFRGRPLIASIRLLVSVMGMPRESQKIDRTMEAFALEWHRANADAPKTINPFLGPDAAFILSFSIMMLNTDLHSGKLDKTLKFDEFKSMNRDIDVGKASLPDEYLKSIYDEVAAHKIELIDVVQTGFDDDEAWMSELQESKAIEETHDRSISLRQGDQQSLASYDRQIFEVVWRPCVSAFASLLQASTSNISSTPLASTVEEMCSLLPSRELLVVNGALAGLQSCAAAAAALSSSSSVDHVVQLLLSFIDLDLRNGFISIQKLGRSPQVLLVARLLAEVVTASSCEMAHSWYDFGVHVGKLLLLGCFADDGLATQDGPDPAIPEALRVNPRVAMPPSQEGTDGGWLGLFGGGSAARRRDRDTEDQRAVLRVRSACPSMHWVLHMCRTLDPTKLREFIRGISAVHVEKSKAGDDITPRTPREAYLASFTAQLVAEVAVVCAGQLEVVADSVGNFFRAVLRGVAAHLRDSHSAQWRDAWTRTISAAHRLLHSSAQVSVNHKARVNLLSAVVQHLPDGHGKELAPVVYVAVQQSLLKAHELDGNLCEHALKLLVWASREATSRNVRSGCATLVVSVAMDAKYPVPSVTPVLAEAVASCALLASEELPSDDGIWQAFAATSDMAPLADIKTPTTAISDTPMDFSSAFVAMQQSLLAHVPGEGQSTDVWTHSLRRLLQSLAAVFFGSATGSVQPKQCSDALLVFQRCILDQGLTQVSPSVCHDIFDAVLLPVVERVCLQPPQQDARRQPAKLQGAFSPSVLITSIFGAVAGPANTSSGGSPQKPEAPRMEFTDDLQSRTASLLPKAVLHLLPQLVAETRLFMALWQRVLGLLYALYSNPASDASLLREAVHENVRNLVHVLATTAASQPEHQLLFAPFPTFWSTTRRLLASFDFAPALVQTLDDLGLGCEA